MSKKLFYYGSTTSFQNLYSNNLGGTNEKVIIPNAAAVNPAGAHTLCCWIKTTSGAAMCPISKFSNFNNNGYELQVFSGKIYAILKNAVLIVSTSNVNTGLWVHVAHVYSGATLKIYVNGVEEGSIATSAYTANTVDFVIGQRADDSFSRWFDGKIAAPALFNTNASTAQVLEIKNKLMGDLRTVSIGANLKWAGYYPNGQADYPTLTDYSGNGNNGTMQNQEIADINIDVPV